MIKGVYFDLGGVFFTDGLDKFLEILSLKTKKTKEEIYPIFRQGKSLKYRENKITGAEFFLWASIQLNNLYTPNELNNLWVSQYEEIVGIRDIVLELKSQNIKVGILSDNVPERVEFLQNKYYFLELFSPVIFSYDVKLTKTNPDIFKLAIEKINIKPSEILFIDDRQVNLDVAQKLGIKTILFENVEKLNQDLKSFYSK